MNSRLSNHTIRNLSLALFAVTFASCGGPSSEDIIGELEKPIERAEYTQTTDVVYLFPVEIDGKWGFIDTLGRIVIEPQYADAWNFSQGLAAVEFEDTYDQAFINYKNEIVSDRYDHVGSYQNGYAYVSQNGFYGFIDLNGELQIPIKFEDAFDFDRGLAIVGKDNKYGLIDTSGSFVLAPDFKDISYFYSDGYADVEGEEGMGLIDSTGTLLLPPIYDDLMTWFDGTVDVEKDGKLGTFLLGEGKVIPVVPTKYDDVTYYDEAKVFVCENGDLMDILNSRGRQVGTSYNNVIDVDTNVLIVERDWKYRMVDVRGKSITKKEYSSIGGFFDGLAAASNDEFCGYLDKKGNEAIAFTYDETYGFGEGLACVAKDDKYGYINTKGEVVIPLQFESASKFVNGRAAVQSEGRWGYIDARGEWVVAPKYTTAYDFGEDGFTYVQNGAKMGLLDHDGNVVIDLKYTDIFEIDLERDLWEIELNEQSGVANGQNQVLLEPIYDEVYVMGKFILLEKGEYFGLAKLNGEVILEPIFDDILEEDRGMISFNVTKSVKGETKDFYGYVNSTGEIVWWPYDRRLLKQRVL